MNKNLKKVISAVAALSMSASSIAVLAVDFPDVDPTASYAQAVSELSALGVISGYDDGTFGPDNLVTRAEITKMIVDALGEGSQAASGSGINTQFTDVTGAHWAAGYVSTGVADGFIAGMGDGTFAPDDNVTYVQAQKMLVSAIGYETYAQGAGGWPNGYKTWAATRGITKGVSANDNDQLTRAQVAQMIDNAMNAPVCVISKYEPDVWGNPQPVLDIMDGEGKDYQTLFTKKHDAYKVYGRVTATSKTNSSIENDMVTFQVEKADNFDDEYIKTADDAITEDMYIGDSKADEYLRTYAQALIQKNDDDEYTIISITPAAVNKTVTLLSEDIDESKTDLDNNVLYFYPAGTTRGSVKYQLDENGVEYYVNGVEMGTFDQDALETYIYGNDSNIVTLQKETQVGSSISGDYNVIMITTYATAVVDQVVEKTTQISVNFKDQSAGAKTSLKVEKDDETKSYSFVLDGEEIDVTELEENDVLSISYDESAGFADSNFYSVQVSRNVVADVKCTGVNSLGDEFTIGGEKYSVANGMAVTPETTITYSLYLDVFGRIAGIEETDSSKKLGILANVYQKNNGDYVAEVITNEGVTEEYTVDDANGEDYMSKVTAGSEKTNYPNQVIDYKVSSTGKLTIKEVVSAKDEEAEYKAASDKIGSIRMSDATVILDLSEVETKDTIRVVSKDNLVDGTVYTAYAYNKSATDNTYRFVIITDGIGGITSESQLAVFVESEMVTVDEDDMDAMTVVVEGEEKQIIVDEDADIDVADFSEGDVFVFATNATTGYMTEAIMVFDEDSIGSLDSAADFADWRDNYGFAGNVLAAGLADELSDSEEDVDVIFGAAVNKVNNTIVVASVQSDENGYYVDLAEEDRTITVSDNAKIYTYNFDISKKKGSRVVLDEGIMVTPNVKAAYLDGDNSNDIYYIDHEDVVEEVVFTIVRTFDGDEAQEIYQIVAAN